MAMSALANGNHSIRCSCGKYARKVGELGSRIRVKCKCATASTGCRVVEQ